MNESEQNNGHLNKKQTDAVLALLSCPTVEEASRKAKVSRVSIYEWIKDARFKAELNVQRSRIIDGYVNFLISSSQRAAVELARLLDTKNECLRRLVCKDIIDFSFKSVELQELRDRIQALEEKVKLK